MMLPTELQLIERFSCSRNTVRRAISQLNTEGYVQSIKGKGVVVLENSCSNDFSKYAQFQRCRIDCRR